MRHGSAQPVEKTPTNGCGRGSTPCLARTAGSGVNSPLSVRQFARGGAGGGASLRRTRAQPPRRAERLSLSPRGGSPEERRSPPRSTRVHAGGCVRDARPQGQDAAARTHARPSATENGRGGGLPPLGTVVSCPTARAARPGAQRRGTPKAVRECWLRGCGSAQGRVPRFKCSGPGARCPGADPAWDGLGEKHLPALAGRQSGTFKHTET
jgi:hypothetical protein